MRNKYLVIAPAWVLLLLSMGGCPGTPGGDDAADVSDAAGITDDLLAPPDLAGAPPDLAASDGPPPDMLVLDDGGQGTRVRVVASNLTSGSKQSYLEPGLRILQGLKPDVALMQEFNYGDNSAAALRQMVTDNFGAGFSYFREPSRNIPNGVISRFPILSSGVWEDAASPDRELVWARLDVPGAKDLWAVSVHLLTRDAPTRDGQAKTLVNFISMNVPGSDYLVIGGDFNTDNANEACLGTLAQVVVTNLQMAPQPVDGDGKAGTNASRAKPYDWVLADSDLNPLRVPVKIGAASFPAGLVFDSRVYMPLSDVPPVQQGDSGAPSMQHMAVVKDFVLPN